jgi:hypothetical protein
VAVLMIVGVTLLMFGCDSGTDTHNVDGDYAVGTVQFVFGENQTWTLRDVLITIDTRESRVYFSGIDRDGLLWGYSGRYSRSGNRILASDLPEIDFGSADQLDLRLEFTSSRRFEGIAINWVYENNRLADVGAANITGQETFIRAAQVRDVSATGAEKTPKLEALQ